MKYCTHYYNEGFRDKLETLRKEKRKEDRARKSAEKEEEERKKKFKKTSDTLDDITSNLLKSNSRMLAMAHESYGIFYNLQLI